MSDLALAGGVIERPDLRHSMQGHPEGVRIIQIKSVGAHAGTTGRFFAVVEDV